MIIVDTACNFNGFISNQSISNCLISEASTLLSLPFLLALSLSLRLYIGLGIGVPIIVTLIAVVIVLYCCWWRHNRKKRRRLMQLYIATRLTVRDDEDAPPLYRDNELPEYTEEDPYKSLKAQEVVGVVSEGNVTDDDRETLIQDDNPTTV